jgi:peptide-methionine (S)-S-oxide reductase
MKIRMMFAALLLVAPLHAAQLEKAIFAGGCFWCTQSDLQKVPGVVSVISGYTGGRVPKPSYEEVSAGGTGHRESVEVTYDPQKISYAKLLDVFWHNIDPTDNQGQFCDKGPEYRSAVFYLNESQRQLALASMEAVRERFGTIYTDILPSGPFYRAEEYHQDYHKKNPVRYHFYRFNCGRDQRLRELWGPK